MVNPSHNPNNNNDDFYARALASFNQHMTLANNNNHNNNTAAVSTANDIINVEEYAKSLVEDDSPKIDAAVKSYLSLVAARSVVASDIDVLPSGSTTTTTNNVVQQCTFATLTKSALDANRCALICARTLLSTINSTTIPSTSFSAIEGETSNASNNDIDETKTNEEERAKLQLQKNTTEVLWNRLVQQSSSSSSSSNNRSSTGEDKTRQIKPSKVLGRTSLFVAYPYIQERFRRGVLLSENKFDTDDTTDNTTETKTNPLDSLSNDVLPQVNPPKGIELDQWKAFYTEFGILLSRACSVDDDDYDAEAKEETSQNNKETVEQHHDDSALLWSNDKGLAELQSRRVNRAQRATKALASVDDAKTAVVDALGESGC